MSDQPADNLGRALGTSNPVKLWELDFGPSLGLARGIEENIRRFVADSSDSSENGVTLGSVPYTPIPMTDDGFDLSAGEAPKRPVLEIANGDGVISSLLRSIGDIRGSIITRTRVFPEHLDDGADPDPLSAYDPEVYRVERIIAENRFTLAIELSALLDIEIDIPRGVAASDFCRWAYKDLDTCGWTPVDGAYFNEEDVPLVDGSEDDNCGLRSTSCAARFNVIGKPLRFGGFVGITRLLK